jgi:hypothetical protein
MEIDWQDLDGRIVSRYWRTNEVDKQLAETLSDIAIQEFKKEITAYENQTRK